MPCLHTLAPHTLGVLGGAYGALERSTSPRLERVSSQTRHKYWPSPVCCITCIPQYACEVNTTVNSNVRRRRRPKKIFGLRYALRVRRTYSGRVTRPKAHIRAALRIFVLIPGNWTLAGHTPASASPRKLVQVQRATTEDERPFLLRADGPTFVRAVGS